jgi:predicted aspartyl protease
MEHGDMGRVLIEATVENLQDLWDVRRGMLPADKVRRVSIPNALVYTGATTLALPKRIIDQLGLSKQGEKRTTTAKGLGTISIYDPARLTIMGREATVDVLELPDEVPALIGQIPLEMMDFVVDPQGRRLIGNPAHGGEQIIEML